jgi:hypothetical protein
MSPLNRNGHPISEFGQPIKILWHQSTYRRLLDRLIGLADSHAGEAHNIAEKTFRHPEKGPNSPYIEG